MELRIVTIWATGLMSLLTFFVPIVLSCFALYALRPQIPGDYGFVAITAMLFWVCSGLPMVISYFIARKVKHLLSIIIILCPTIAYMIYYVYWLCQMFFVDALMFFWVMFAGMLFAPIMIPVWIVAVILDYYHADLKTMAL